LGQLFENTPFPSETTELGRDMEVSRLSEKTSSQMEVTELGIVTEVNLLS